MSVVAFLATLAGGGLGGVLLRAGHERTEAARNRLIDAAEQLLDATQTARSVFDTFRNRTSDREVVSLASAAAEQEELTLLNELEPTANGPMHEAHGAVKLLVVQALAGLRGRFDEGWEPGSRERFEAQLGAARAALQDAHSDGRIPATLFAATSRTLNDTESWFSVSEEQQAAFGVWAKAQYDVQAAIARVTIVFAPRRRIYLEDRRPHMKMQISPAIDSASNIPIILGAAGAKLHEEVNAGRNPGVHNKDVTLALSSLEGAVAEFAQAANSVIRRVWL